jgi:hypothetical protein
MLAPLIDHAVLIYFVLACLALGLAAAWWSTRKRGFLIGIGIAAGFAALVVLLTLFVPTDRKRITQVLQDMVDGVRHQDLDRTFRHIADDFTAQFFNARLDKKGLRARAEAAVRAGGVNDIDLWDFDWEEMEASRAVVFFNARPYGAWATGLEFCGCRAEFRLGPDGNWRMTKLALFKPGSTEPLDWPLP